MELIGFNVGLNLRIIMTDQNRLAQINSRADNGPINGHFLHSGVPKLRDASLSSEGAGLVWATMNENSYEVAAPGIVHIRGVWLTCLI